MTTGLISCAVLLAVVLWYSRAELPFPEFASDRRRDAELLCRRFRDELSFRQITGYGLPDADTAAQLRGVCAELAVAEAASHYRCAAQCAADGLRLLGVTPSEETV